MTLELPVTATRLRERMEEIGTSQGSLADAVGCSQGAISKILTGHSHNSRHLPRIAAVLAVNLNWLLGVTDEKIDMFDEHGDDLSEDELAALKAGVTSRRLLHPEQLKKNATGDARLSFRHAPAERDPDLVELEEINLRLGLGGTYLENHVDVQKRRFSRAWLRHFTDAAPEHLFWSIGDGDSMEPTIRSGEMILIDRSQQAPRMGDGIWAIAYGEIGMVKRLRPLPDGSVEIHSDNPLIPPARAVDGELHVIGRVVAVVRRL